MKNWFLKIALLLVLGIAFLFTLQKVRKNAVVQAVDNQYNLALGQIRGVAKLVIWEQDFMLQNTITQSRKYFGVFTAEEKLASNIKGRMGFHLDLADTVNTLIARRGDTLFVQAPLQLTYVQMDMSSLKQVKENSLDPSLEIDRLEAAKTLDEQAVKTYLPGIVANLQRQGPGAQEQQLSRLTGLPVRILYTRLPQTTDYPARVPGNGPAL